ncbi:DUF1566 domain-containing protein, partial [bacterium]|nr:DUF1566 domain-containing protein [bacterium]
MTSKFIKTNKTIALLFPLFFFLFASFAYGSSLRDTLNNAIQDLKVSGKLQQNDRLVISEVINLYTNKKDQLSNKIESELYLAFENSYPEMQLVDASESVSGISTRNTVFLKGTYQQKGGVAYLNLKVLKGTMSGEVLYRAEVSFNTEYHQKELVAVLDMEAKTLNAEQQKIFSDVFREALGETGAFEMASKPDINQKEYADIQATTGCAKQACDKIIRERMGVTKVIASSFRMLDKDYYYLSAKIMNIKDDSIIVSKTVKHSGSIRTFDKAIRELALKLTGTDVTPAPAVVQDEPVKPTSPIKPSKTVVGGDIVRDGETGLIWQKDEGGEKSWKDGIIYCENLNLSGYSDWRLPDKTELSSSFHLKDSFPDYNNGYYWTSTTNAEDQYYAWGMTGSSGYMFNDGSKESIYHIRCVRGSRSMDSMIVKDSKTGLIWQRENNGYFKWHDAIDFCKQLKLADEKDWRLPTKEELESSYAIQDKFLNLSGDYYWSSTERSRIYAWGLTVSSGYMFSNGIKYKSYNVRCVRGG